MYNTKKDSVIMTTVYPDGHRLVADIISAGPDPLEFAIRVLTPMWAEMGSVPGTGVYAPLRLVQAFTWEVTK